MNIPAWKLELMDHLNSAALMAEREDDPDYNDICTLLGSLGRND